MSSDFLPRSHIGPVNAEEKCRAMYAHLEKDKQVLKLDATAGLRRERHGIRALAGRRFKPGTTDSRQYLLTAPDTNLHCTEADSRGGFTSVRKSDSKASCIRRGDDGPGDCLA
jgi:hypothetical protein